MRQVLDAGHSVSYERRARARAGETGCGDRRVCTRGAGRALAKRQALLLRELATNGANLALQVLYKPEAEQWLHGRNATRFARLGRAVRQVIALERGLGAHDDAANDAQMAKLNALAERRQPAGRMAGGTELVLATGRSRTP